MKGAREGRALGGKAEGYRRARFAASSVSSNLCHADCSGIRRRLIGRGGFPNRSREANKSARQQSRGDPVFGFTT